MGVKADRPDCKRGSLPQGDGPDYCITCSEYMEDWVRWNSHRELVDQIVFLRKMVEELKHKIRRRDVLLQNGNPHERQADSLWGHVRPF